MVDGGANFPNEIDDATKFLIDFGCKYINKKALTHAFLCPCGLVQLTTSDEQNKEKEVVRIRLINSVELR